MRARRFRKLGWLQSVINDVHHCVSQRLHAQTRSVGGTAYASEPDGHLASIAASGFS